MYATLRFSISFFFAFICVGVFANINADFIPDKLSGCPPLVVSFTDTTAGGATSWQWDFGNGNGSTLQNPSATFIKPGSYKVKLIATKGTEVDSITKIISVYNPPSADFVADKPSACFYDTIHFQSTTIAGDAPLTDFGWGFGNGLAISANAITTYKYNALGAYTITLVVQDGNKCSSSKTITDYIHVWPVPTAAFTASPTSSCLPSQLVKFTDQSVGTGLQYFWDLDGSGIVNDTNPTHTYSQQKYISSLTVVDLHGCQTTATKLISVAGPSAEFKASKVLVCTGEKVQFTNISNFTGTTWNWDFGDGTGSSLQNPQKTYTQGGIYDISFMISDGVCTDSTDKPKYMNVRQGANLPDVSIEADTTRSCTPPLKVHFTNTTPGDIVGYLWNFGDGKSAVTEDPINTYTASNSFTVSLTIMDSSGCIKTGTFPDYISTAGSKVAYSYLNNCAGSSVQFANKTPKSDSCWWDFGDNTFSTLNQPTHTFSGAGTYKVKLTVVNDLGCVSNKTDNVLVDSVNVDFKVNATYSPCPPFVAMFKNTSDLGAIIKYNWDFGDGVTDTTTNPTHIYFYPGTYTVTLIGYTKAGCSDTLVMKDMIMVQGPTAQFTVSPTTGCLPLDVNFSVSVSSNTKAIWADLGDGTVIQDTLQYTHLYTQERTFKPQYVLTDHVGCSVSYPVDSIVTHALPQLQVKDTSVCKGIELNMSPISNADRFIWSPASFIDCDTCKNIKINSPDTINYHVSAITKYGCKTEGNFTVNVEPLPVLITPKIIHLCSGDTISLSVGDDAAKIKWTPDNFINDATSFSPICFPSESIEYTATGYNHLGCTSVAKVDLNVQGKLDITLPETINVCEFDTLHLWVGVNFASDLGVQYTWSPSQYLDNANSPNPVANLTTHNIDFQVIASSGHCIGDTATVTANVIATPIIEVSEDVKTTAGAEVSLYAASREELSYTWFAKDELSCTGCKNPVIYPTTSQLVYVLGKNEYGCTIMDSVAIEVQNCNPDAIFMPNTFTPNGDGINDQFVIRTNALSSLDYFRIYDQWGRLVYETHQLNQGWDGMSGGKPNGTAVYVYVLEGKCQNGNSVIKNGNITAIR